MQYKIFILYIFLFLFIYPATAVTYNSIIVLNTTTPEELLLAIDDISLQTKITHIYPPNILFVNITNVSILPANPNITLISSSIISNNSNPIILSWNKEHTPQSQRTQLQPAIQPAPIINDSINYYRPSQQSQPNLPQDRIYGATFYDTSEYLIGNIAVGVLLPENNLTWSDDQEINVITEIRNGLDWWISKEPLANLTFTYDIHTRIPVSIEPTSQKAFPNQSEWINETLENLSYTNYSDFYFNILDYNNHIRNTYQTDWAYTIFIVNGQYFTDNYFAYAYLGGPATIMTYTNDGYGINNMDAVIAHETGHIFYANDQYSSALRPCTEKTGYFATENQNSQLNCLSNTPSIMRGQVTPFTNNQLDPYARQQLGWRDTNNNSILDILDFPPNISILNISYPNITVQVTSTTTLQSQNPLYYLTSPSSITLNRIKTIQYQINNDNWTTYLLYNKNAINNLTTTIPLPNNTKNITIRAQIISGLSTELTIPINSDINPPLIYLTTTQSNTSINISITSSEQLSSIILEWNGINESVTTTINKTNLPNNIYNYRIIANDTSNNWNSTPIYIAVINYLPLTHTPTPLPSPIPTSPSTSSGGGGWSSPNSSPTSTPIVTHPILTTKNTTLTANQIAQPTTIINWNIIIILSIISIIYLLWIQYR